MGFGSQSIEFIRKFFRQGEFERPPFVPVTAYGALSHNAPYFSYGMNSGSLQGVTDYLRVDSDLVARYIDYEDQDDSPLIASALDIYCLAGETKIPLLDGRCFSIQELSELKSWDSLWVYSSNGVALVPAKIKSAQKTGISQRVLKVTLDDGSVIRATENHKFMLRNGRFSELKNLKPGQSLMPLYRSKNKRGYEQVFDDGWTPTHRWSFLNIHGYLPKNKHGNNYKTLRVIHHKDFNKLNNNPENLQELSWHDHKTIHQKHASLTLHTPELIEKIRIHGREQITKFNKDKWSGEKSDYYSKISTKNYTNIWKKEGFKDKMKPIQSKNMKRLCEAGENKHFGRKNPKFRTDITYEDIVKVAQSIPFERRGKANIGPSKITIGKVLGCKYRVLNKRVLDAGFKNWTDFKENVLGITKHHNHKIVSIEACEELSDVYDLTIEGDTHCFAAGDGNSFVIVHNSDDSTQVDNEKNKTVWIEAEDEDVRRELDDLLHVRLKIEEHIWSLVRILCKYGNNFFEIVAQDQKGVIALNSLPPPTVRRVEVPKEIGQKVEDRADLHWDTLGFIYDPRGVFKLSTPQFIDELKFRVTGEAPKGERPFGVTVFESWEVVHMRLMGKSPTAIYGFGLGEPARWIFKRLLLLEDSILLHRLTRSPSRFAFYVDVSGIPPNEVSSYLNRVKQGLKKQKFVNPSTNKIDLKYSPLSPDDDFFLPMREGRETTRVENLQGPIYDHIEDIKFFENKLFAALKVPKPFLTYEESTAKTHLSAEDARFARTILRIQREVRNGLRKVCRVHLSAKGVNPDAVDFDVCMTIPSAIFQLAQLEIRNAELELADKYKGWAPLYWIKTRILGWSDDQIREMKMDGDEGPEEAPSSGAMSGSIEKALAKQKRPNKEPSEPTPTSKATKSKPSSSGSVKSPAEKGQLPGEPEVASKQTPAVMLSGIHRNTSTLVENIRSQNKLSDKRTDELLSRIKELRCIMDLKK